ncbi:uncharacterized protein LOC143264017 [Megachile rotundata]|uniref:uncharacterized protein LOC143264017 n=1 Tax=Megachile rotundata TaxID=143995 RepID=UPI003FD30AB6
MILTMIDNKICNSITNTSSAMPCYICGATPTDMNNLDLIDSKAKDSVNLEFGISSLHAWIRCMECLLHISYNLQFKKWTANTPELKTLRKETKKRIQQEFRDKLVLYIDYVQQGWGSSNDGNTARRFFSNAEVSAEITGVELNLIKRFHIILQVISSPYKINTTKFHIYTQDTVKYYVQNYGWYYMPTSVHKILIHGTEIIQNALLPIGQISEEAQETRHKDFKRIRCKNTRKSSRVSRNGDTLHRLLLTSDPYISNLRLKSLFRNKDNNNRPRHFCAILRRCVQALIPPARD